MLNYDRLQMRYTPFPIGRATGVFEADFYKQLVDGWPDKERFVSKETLGRKYSLSEVNNPSGYHEFIQENAAYKRLYDWFKSADFKYGMIDFLAGKKIDLDYPRRSTKQKLKSMYRDLRYKKHWPRYPSDLSARFEFSMLPSDGGSIRPHTDAPQKIITLVLSIVEPEGWPEGVSS